jgi:hypothetical protein
VFVLGKTLQLSTIFVNNDQAYPSGAPHLLFPLRVGSRGCIEFQTYLNAFSSKHSSFLRYGVNYDSKIFTVQVSEVC